MNLPRYDSVKNHLGFIFCINYVNFKLETIPNLSQHFKDTLKTVVPEPQSGFNIGFIEEYKLYKNLKLRIMPNLGFMERDIDYSVAGVDTFIIVKRIESTFMNLPIDLKWVSNRIKRNIQVYVLGGINLDKDLSSQKGINQQQEGPNSTVILEPYDFAYEAGAGLQFFFKSFKLGIDLKLSLGTQNVMIPDQSIYTQSIQSLHSKIYLLTFSFGG